VRVGILGEECPNAARSDFGSAPASDLFQDLVIARASVDVAYIDLIEHVVECLPIAQFAIQTT
jgi:hypothetical protein